MPPYHRIFTTKGLPEVPHRRVTFEEEFRSPGIDWDERDFLI
jgi:hypothetical protein